MIVRVVLAFSLLLCPLASTARDSVDKISVSEAAQLVEERLKETVELVIKKLLPSLVRSSGDIDLSPECQAAIFQVIGGIRDLKPWAVNRKSIHKLIIHFKVCSDYTILIYAPYVCYNVCFTINRTVWK